MRRCWRFASEILETATELFAEQGFSDAVTQALAAKLQVGKGTIYRHFPSKRELFLAARRSGDAEAARAGRGQYRGAHRRV